MIKNIQEINIQEIIEKELALEEIKEIKLVKNIITINEFQI